MYNMSTKVTDLQVLLQVNNLKMLQSQSALL